MMCAFPVTWALSMSFTLDTVLSMSLSQNTLARVATFSLLKELLIAKSLLNTALPAVIKSFYPVLGAKICQEIKQVYLPFTTRSPMTFPFCMKELQNWLISSTRGSPPPTLGTMTKSFTAILFLMCMGFVNFFLPVTCKTRSCHSKKNDTTVS